MDVWMLACNFFVFFTLIEYCYAQGCCENGRENNCENRCENCHENVIFTTKKDSYSKKAACDKFISPQHEYQNGFRKVFLLVVNYQPIRTLKI